MSLLWPITRPPIVPWDEKREDNVLRSNTENGYELTRQRYTKVRDTLGPFTWQYLSGADYNTLMTFFDTTTASGSLPFSFSASTRTSTITKTVRFTAPPDATYIGHDKWLVKCTFREV
jgi:hypothetical protein